MFDDWLPRQSCLSLERVDSFRDIMVKYASGNLKALGLGELAEKVERRASEIILDMKERQKVFYSVDAARAFLASHSLSPKTPVADLVQWPEEIENLKRELKKARKIRDVPEIEDFMGRLDRFEKDCQRQEKENWDLHTELIESSFLTIEEIEDAHERLGQVIDIFAGQELEFEDLKKLQRHLKILAETESLPVYIDGEDARKIETSRQQVRSRLSELWISDVYRRPDEISELGAVECQRFLPKTEAAPDYATDEDRRRVLEMRMALNVSTT